MARQFAAVITSMLTLLASHLVRADCVPPYISSEPVSQAVCVAGSCSFSVQSAGSASPIYRWHCHNGPEVPIALSDGGNISGSQSATLTINPVGTSDARFYFATVADPCNPTQFNGSQSAFLNVCSIPQTCPASPDQACFSGLGFFSSGNYSRALGISGDGTTVIGHAHLGMNGEGPHRQPHPFVWRTGQPAMIMLTSWYTTWSAEPFGVSFDGSVIGGYVYAAASEPISTRWNSDGSWSFVDAAFYDDGAHGHKAFAVSADGSTFVGWSWDGGSGHFIYRAYRHSTTGGGMTIGLGDLPLPGAPYQSAAYGVSGDGSVVVGKYLSQGFRWTQETGMTSLQVIPRAISADGSTIVGEGEIWRDGSLTLLQDIANAVSADGSVVVGGGDGSNAFIWDAQHGTRILATVLTNVYQLNISGWNLQSATGVSADGTVIVGYGIHAGKTEAWIARLPTCLTCFGDTTGDTHIDGTDVQAFAACFATGSLNGPGCRCADLTADNLLTASDVSPFVNKLLGLTASGCN